ncbi:MAG: polyribonucleotide nucleotidyltransferase [Spirochaetes bacterium]|nr:MAG: polyribonucleotide nucleotidyltransferase [Spirochaetota bacterium]
MLHQVKLRIGDEDLVLETGRMAKQANGAVLATYAGSAVLATVCCSDKKIEDLDYIPLSVEYNEKYYAAGKIPGGFIKREGRPKDKEILVSRLIDRPMRPLFNKEFKREIQIVPTTISTDQINPPDIIAMAASSAAVMISDIPFNGPVGAVRVAFLDDGFIINPTFDEIERAKLDIVVSGTEEGITMVEGGAKEISEDILLKAIEEAHGYIKEICRIQIELTELAGKEKIAISDEKGEFPLKDKIREWAYPKMEEACFVAGKQIRSAAIKKVKEEALSFFAEDMEEGQEKAVSAVFEDIESEIVRKSILERKMRTDGRKPEDIRNITCEVDVLPRTHGSALFTRGETQALAVTTLGTVYDEQIMDDIEGDARKTFMLHYNFPPYSVGETGRLGTGRREIGHGHLAERAISAVLPSKDKFPYTIRIVSEILESNGSSSMATVCGGTLSLLNAGVPIKKSVAGIAMGLVTDSDKFVILSDILGEEDHLGDMDFKVAGTEDGITAFQMDIKIAGVDYEILSKALEQAKEGRKKILSIMNDTIKEPRSSISDFAPKIMSMHIDPDKIGAVIGSGGKVIKGISEKTGATINIEDTGDLVIYCKDKKGAEEAKAIIESLLEEPEVGKIYNGTVKRIMDFGAFIEILPGKEGLCHISKLSDKHVQKVTDVLEEGQQVTVKLIEIDRMGRLNLSIRDVNEDTSENNSHSDGKGQETRDHGRRSYHKPRRR